EGRGHWWMDGGGLITSHESLELGLQWGQTPRCEKWPNLGAPGSDPAGAITAASAAKPLTAAGLLESEFGRSTVFVRCEPRDEAAGSLQLDRELRPRRRRRVFHHHGCGVCGCVAHEERMVLAAAEESQIDPKRPGLRTIRDADEPRAAAAARERRHLADLAPRQ